MKLPALSAVRTLPRAVWLLGLVSLCNDTASELVYPLVPLFLAGLGGATPRVLGLIEGIAEASGALLKLVSGALADRHHSSRPWLIAGYGVAAVARPLIALARHWPLVAVLRLADRLGKGLRTSPRDALLARVAPPGRRGLAFGLHRAMDNTGAVVGPLLAAAALAAHLPLRTVFLYSALPGALAVALAWLVHEPPPATDAPPSSPIDWNPAHLPPRFRRFLLIYALFTLGNASNMFLLLRARNLGVPVAQVPLLWAVVSLTAMLFSTPLSALSDRVGRARLIVGGWLLYAALYLLFGWLPGHATGSGVTVWLLFGTFGLHLAASEGAEKALVADLVAPGQLGSAYGWFNLTAGAMLFPASYLFGWLWQVAGPGVAFSVAASCAVVAAMLFALQAATPVGGRGNHGAAKREPER